MSTKRTARERASAVPPKRQRKMLTIAEKVGLLDMLNGGKSYAAVGRQYGINESTVRYIKKEENNIRTTAAINFNKDAKRVVTVRNKTIVKMESALALWISECKKKNIRLNTNIIRTKAKKLYDTFADSEQQDDVKPGPSACAFQAEPSPFSASKGWFEKFQQRFGLKSKPAPRGKAAASANPAGEEEAYVNKFKAIIQEGGYKPEQVFNMAEMALFWKRMPSRTFLMQDEAKASGFNAQKDRVTLVMCGNAAGFMIKPGLICRSKNPRGLQDKSKSALPVYWMHNAKASMTKALHADWFQHCFVPEVKRYLRERGLDFKALLLVANGGGHAEDLSYDGVRIDSLPPNTTWLIQPMDQGVIRFFKALYTRNTLQHLVEAVDSDQGSSLRARWRDYTIASSLQNIQRAVQEMTGETLNVCWRKLWPEAVREPTGGGCSLDEVHHSAVEAAVSLAKRLGGDGFDDMTPHDINALIDDHLQPLTDEDLAEMTKPPSEDEGGEEDEENTPVVKEEEVEQEEEDGLTRDRLATMVRMAAELQRAAQEWDPVRFRSQQFSNVIEGGVSVYKNLLAQKKKQHQQLLITMFCARKKAPAPRSPEDKDAAAEQRQDKGAPS